MYIPKLDLPILYSDCDGVLINSIDVSYDMMIEMGCDMNNRNEVDYFFRKVIDWNEVFRRVQIINDGPEKLKILKESGLFKDVVIATGICGNYSEEGLKRIFFGDILPGMRVITIQYGIPKALAVPKAYESILVDDEPRNGVKWEKYGGEAVLFIPNHSNLEKNIISDILDVPNTQAYKKLIKTRNF
jgi:hypothetical protein